MIDLTLRPLRNGGYVRVTDHSHPCPETLRDYPLWQSIFDGFKGCRTVVSTTYNFQERSVCMRVLTVIGARPQFVKAGVVSKAFIHAGIEEILVHTGQHYDAMMSDVFPV